MAIIKSFKGLRYNPNKIQSLKDVSAPPYDIISPVQQKEYYAKSPFNVIRLEYGCEEQNDNDNSNKYTRAGDALKKWIADDILTFEDEPALYIYQQIFNMPDSSQKSFKGIITLVELEEFSKGVVLPHEETLSKAKTDRFNLMSTTFSNFSQIYSLYLDSEQKTKIILDSATNIAPDITFIAEDDIIQNLWIIKDKATQEEITKSFIDRQLFIADGHHRYETAINFRDKLRSENANWDSSEQFNFVMMMLVDMDDDGLVVFPTHRLVKDIGVFSEELIISKLSENFTVNKMSDISSIEYTLANNLSSKCFAFYTGKDYYYLLTLSKLGVMKDLMPNKSDAYRGLDVAILHSLILDKILGIDLENMANQKNLTYSRSAEDAINLVSNGEFQCSFLLNATKVKEIKDVSLANEKMPQKSTYFWPKLVTGIVMNKFK